MLDAHCRIFALLKLATILGSRLEDLTLLLLGETFCLGHVEVNEEKSCH